jgi:hypothetical protein
LIREAGTHSGPEQQVLTAQRKPAAQVLPAPQAVRLEQDVEPGMQAPPPVPVVTHMQSAFELLHALKVAQAAPTHSGWGFPLTPWADTVLAVPRIIGAM